MEKQVEDATLQQQGVWNIGGNWGSWTGMQLYWLSERHRTGEEHGPGKDHQGLGG